MRHGGDSKALRIHAEKFPIDSKTHLQVHGELDTRTGTPSNFCAIIRHFYPDDCAMISVIRCATPCEAKKSFPITKHGLVNFVVKGRYDVNQEFKGVTNLLTRENKWTLNADMNGRWSIRFDL